MLRRGYDAPIADVWDAITNPERIGRWFLPVTGDLRLGGRYQLKGNAGGEVLRCEPPRLLTVTWVFGDQRRGGHGDREHYEVLRAHLMRRHAVGQRSCTDRAEREPGQQGQQGQQRTAGDRP